MKNLKSIKQLFRLKLKGKLDMVNKSKSKTSEKTHVRFREPVEGTLPADIHFVAFTEKDVVKAHLYGFTYADAIISYAKAIK